MKVYIYNSLSVFPNNQSGDEMVKMRNKEYTSILLMVEKYYSVSRLLHIGLKFYVVVYALFA